MTPEDARAWVPVIRDYLALLVGSVVGTYAVVTGMPGLAVISYSMAGLAADYRRGILAAIGAALVAWWRKRKGGPDGPGT